MITIAVGPFRWLVPLAVKMGIIAQNNTLKKREREKCLTITLQQFIWTKDICQLNVSDGGSSEPTTLRYLRGMKTDATEWQIIHDNSNNIRCGVLHRPNDVKLTR